MVRVSDNKVFIKILYWGSAASGKTTAVDTLYHLTESQKMDVKPTGNLVKIAMASGSTLYFDRARMARQDRRLSLRKEDGVFW
jgi:GTPase SAR1 family protein